MSQFRQGWRIIVSNTYELVVVCVRSEREMINARKEERCLGEGAVGVLFGLK